MSNTSFQRLDKDLMRERFAPPSGPVRLLIDTDTANEIDDQYALAWALLSSEHMHVEAVTTEPFYFAHHQAGLIRAEQAMENGDSLEEHLVDGFQGWIKRQNKQGRCAIDLDFISPAKGMELRYEEIHPS